MVEKRKISVMSTLTGLKSIESDAQTWGELKNDLYNEGISYSDMSAIVAETRVKLISSDSVIPEKSFTLYLMAEKSKAGGQYDNMSYLECKASIKYFIDKLGDRAKEHFNSNDRNYTNKSTAELRNLLNSFDYNAYTEPNIQSVKSTNTEINTVIEVTDDVKAKLSDLEQRIKKLEESFKSKSENNNLANAKINDIQSDFFRLQSELELQ